jgi:hypothetical protein
MTAAGVALDDDDTVARPTRNPAFGHVAIESAKTSVAWFH